MSILENIVTKVYDFTLYLIPQLEKLPRAQKFLLSDRIENLLLEILEDVIDAYYTKKENKRQLLENINISLEKMRFLIRLTHDLRYINHEKYGIISAKINDIGSILGGWIKSLK